MKRPARWLARLLLLLVVTAVTLKAADLALGYFWRTQEQHLLRLPAHARYRHRSTEFDYIFWTNALG